MNQSKGADRLSIGVAGFVVMRVWFVIQWRGSAVFVYQNGERRRNRRRGEGERGIAR